MTAYTEYLSPISTLLLTSDGYSLTGLWMERQNCSTAGMTRCDGLPLFGQVRQWLDAYFHGENPEVTFPLSPGGTPFQRRVWDILLRIPYGKTTTYGHIAREISPGMSAQAVGGAVGRNPISIIIPCHRCLGAKGQLTGYAGGLENKMWLLRHEGCTIH